MTTLQNLYDLSKVYPINDIKENLIDLLTQKLAFYGIQNCSVRRAYPLEPVTGAMITVTRTKGSWRKVGLGQVVGETRDTEAGEAKIIRGVGLQQTVEVAIWAPNEDLRDLLFALVQAVVLEETPELQRQGINDLSVSDSTDDEIDDPLVTNTYWYRSVLYFSGYVEMHTNDIAQLVQSVNVQWTLMTNAPVTEEP